MTLATLTLDQIPALTDEECDALYHELCGRAEPVSEDEAVEAAARIIGDRPQTVRRFLNTPSETWHRATTEQVRAYRLPVLRVSHPDCPASVLEGLPALVDRWTGVAVDIHYHATVEGVQVSITPNISRAFREENRGAMVVDRVYAVLSRNAAWQAFKPRHLPHACFAAAFAACVVLGRKESP